MKLILAGLAALAFSGAPVFADHHECNCDKLTADGKACTEACAKGGNKNCKCEGCDCGKTGKCKHKKCSHSEKTGK